MMKFLVAAALMTIGMTAHAGSWQYGCTGQLPWGDRIYFNRSTLVTVSKDLSTGSLFDIANDDLNTYDATDVNTGFEKTMTFEHKWEGGQTDQVILTEQASRTTRNASHNVSCGTNRVREIDQTTYQKTYDIKMPNFDKPITVKLNCYEHMITACG